MTGVLWFSVFAALTIGATYAIWLSVASVLSIPFWQLLIYLALFGAGYALGVSRQVGKW